MSEPVQILVVDDDRATAGWLHSVLTAEGYECEVAHSREEAEAVLSQKPFHIAFADIYLGDANGLDLVKRVQGLQPECNCVVMTAHATVETAARSVVEGALEYLGKPLLIDELLAVVRRLAQPRKPNPEGVDAAAADFSPESAIIGRSPRMLEVYRAIARVAPSDATVLISGASGTGKELVAKAIHAHSSRAEKPFTPINCGSLPETLLESELFGHEKGAFTGAAGSRRGLIEATQGGTLFLDEVSETSLSFQVNLLRMLQERQVRRLGSNQYVPVDVRIVAATNRDLPEQIRAGKFREDLYYRLSVVTIRLPSLEERREDIPLLVRHFLESFNRRNDRHVTMGEEAMAQLAAGAWPGNVRELENVIERLAIFSPLGEITPADVARVRSEPADSSAKQSVPPPPSFLREIEKEHILRALKEAEGNRSLAARRLGIERKLLYKKARRLGIDLGSGER